jgi:hypothetical protein
MAQKVQTLFVDDLDGSEAEGTVRFGLDGTEYEIDLNAQHGRQLRDALYYSRVFTLSVWLLPHRSLSRAAPAARCDGE